jgi:diguanylate cyclase (GGDEF)-like protein
MLGFHHVMHGLARRPTDDDPRAALAPARRVLATLAALASVAVIAWVDALLPAEVPLVLVYVFPIAACAWWLGGRTAAFVAVVAGFAFALHDLPARVTPSLGAFVWRAFSVQVLFLALGLALARVRLSRDRLAAANRLLSEHLERESALARTDPRTGLPNVRSFLDHLGTEVARRRRDGRAMSVAYIDLDNFKQVNDIYGHAAGDDLLARIGQGIREAVRGGDVFARMGGDEFAVAFAETSSNDVMAIAQRLAARVRAICADYPKAGADCSIGIASFDVTPEDPEVIVHCADAAMYQAKQQGKGRIVVSDHATVEWVAEDVTSRFFGTSDPVPVAHDDGPAPAVAAAAGLQPGSSHGMP